MVAPESMLTSSVNNFQSAEYDVFLTFQVLINIYGFLPIIVSIYLF